MTLIPDLPKITEGLARSIPILRSLARSAPGVAARQIEQSLKLSSEPEPTYFGLPSSVILDVLLDSAASNFGDPRDHVYGIIGMSKARYRSKAQTRNRNQPEIIVDYQKSVGQVFVDVAKYLVERDGRYGILFLEAGYGKDADQEMDLPSWCPDGRT